MRDRRRGVDADVQPLSLSGVSRSGESSTSARSDDDTAFASPALWQALIGSTEQRSGGTDLHISVRWPDERRLKGRDRARNLVARVRRANDDFRYSQQDKVLCVPVQLLPRFMAIPIRAKLFVHQPVRLSTTILQPILGVGLAHDERIDPQTLDLSALMGYSGRHLTNGYANGDSDEHSRTPVILREGHNIVIPYGPSETRLPFRIAMLEPASQGYITTATRVIVSDTPYDTDAGARVDHVDGILDAASSHGRTHISLADFDPDSFLSSSLDSAFWPATSDDTDIDGDIARSISSTSGSITPRPPGTYLPDPPSPPIPVNGFDGNDEDDIQGVRFSAVQTAGPSGIGTNQDVCWISVGGLGRAGIFEGDWVMLRAAGSNATGGRLAKVMAWERLDEDDDDDLPIDPILVPPTLYRSLFSPDTPYSSQHYIRVQATPFGARIPIMPMARTMTMCRIATTEGIDKRYERSWLEGLKQLFVRHGEEKQSDDTGRHQAVRRGDVFAVPVWQGKPIPTEEDSLTDSDEEGEDEFESTPRPTALVYFKVTAMSFEPLVPLEDDFRSSISSKARAGELGCWVDVGEEGETQLVLEGMERDRILEREAEKSWHSIEPCPSPFDKAAEGRLRDLLRSTLNRPVFTSALQLSTLLKGARGAGKKSLLSYVAAEVGYNIIKVDCYDIVGEEPAVTEGSLSAQLDKALAASPSVLLLDHIGALAKRSESSATGRTPPMVKVLEDLMHRATLAAVGTGFPVILAGMVVEEDAVPAELLAIFKQDITLDAPDETQRLSIVYQAFSGLRFAPDIEPRSIATQTAALQAGDIRALARRASENALLRVQQSAQNIEAILQAGLSITSADVNSAINDARASYSDSIGAPKIPNVSWDDIGGLQAVKNDILDTIQLPLQHPELFAEGLKKRSGILLYGPPGTGKTLLAKAVATSCSLNFFSVKGPELLNMYIGESEANVRRVFQRARDASPCVVFMDELDSVAPKRGNQGDSGGVMDRIVSQLLAELDGMSSGGGNAQVYVLGATNRPDLLDPALLRPGRFDRMLYLSVPTTNSEQLSILRALTRKFKLDSELSLEEISEMCPFNYTGADFYALCSDAMLKAMTRAANNVDQIVERLNLDPQGRTFPKPLTVQYYLASMASPEDIEVKVGREDFVQALSGMKPSVSESEMRHYERVQQEFKGFSIGENR